MHRQTTFRIKSGCHAGAHHVLAKGTSVTTGRDACCDLILSDAAVSDRHFRLESRRDGVMLTALDAPVSVEGRGSVEPGFRTLLTGSAPLRVGGGGAAVDVEIEIPRRRPRRLVPSVLMACSALLLSGVIATPAGHRLAEPASVRAAAIEPVASPPSRQAATAPRSSLLPGSVAVGGAVRAELARLGLDTLTLETGGGTLQLSGLVPEREFDAFRAFERWFDASFPGTVLRSDVAAEPEAAPPPAPAIQSVWQAEQPWIVVGGRRYHEGDRLPGGWHLTGIGTDHADFTRDGTAWRVDLTGEASSGDGRLARR